MKMSYDYFQQGKIYKTLTRIVAIPEAVWNCSPKPSKKRIMYATSPAIYFVDNNRLLLFIDWLDTGDGRRNGLFFSEDKSYVIPISENYNFYDDSNIVSNFSRLIDD
jgi:hypothetical protein